MGSQPAPWLSVITVVKDDATGFRRTLDSLRAQDVTGVELVVIDSSSDRGAVSALLEDGTLERQRLEWTPAEGVYPAMNRGLQRAEGEYVLFMNAGDAFADPRVLADLRGHLIRERPIWAFGRLVVVDTTGNRTTTPAWDYQTERRHCFSRGLFPPHQATMARRSALLELGGFDPAYRIAADYAAFLRLSQIGPPLVLDRTIAEFAEGGLSTLEWKASFAEFHRARVSILRPRGLSRLREGLDSAVHFAKVFIYRDIVHRRRYRSS